MVIDSSALLAILLREPERWQFLQKIEAAAVRLIGSVTAVEAAAAFIHRRGPNHSAEFDQLLAEMRIVMVPFTADHYPIARDAWIRFGKGTHKSGLNFGNCCAYATARLAGEPLLFKGDDFRHTDIEAAI